MDFFVQKRASQVVESLLRFLANARTRKPVDLSPALH